MSKSLNTESKTSNKEVELRDAREEMITDDYSGPLYIEDKYKREGFFRRIVDSSRGGRVDYHQRLGYSIVQDQTKVGSGASSNTSIDSAVRVHLGGTKEPMGILMEMPLDRYEARMILKEKRATEQLASTGKTGISSQVGEVVIGNSTFK